jgi:hypothetical protein
MIRRVGVASLLCGAMLLTGCAQSPQPVIYQPQPAIYYQAPEAMRLPAPDYSPAPPRTPAHISLRPLTPEESGTSGSLFSGMASPSVSDCVGWWRICHFLR